MWVVRVFEKGKERALNALDDDTVFVSVSTLHLAAKVNSFQLFKQLLELSVLGVS